MAIVNPDALNVLSREQADEARRIIDEIGFVSNDLGATDNDDRYPVIA